MKSHPFLSLALFFILAGASVTACAVTYDSATWRYRMTVEVDTPEGIKTGSAVREIHAFREPKVFSEQTSGHAGVAKGEAVVVDLGKRGVLFALLRGGRSGQDYGYQIVFDAFPYRENAVLSSRGIDYYSHLVAGPVTLTPEQYPMFVRFHDLQDPKTVEVLSVPNSAHAQEKAATKNVEDALGSGVQIRSVTIQMTDDPVTTEVKKYMPTYEPQAEYMKWFNSLPYGDPRKIGPYDFKTGGK